MFAENFGQGKKWLPGKIVSQKGPVTFEIELEDGRSCQCHQHHVRKGSEEEQSILPHEASEREVVWQTSEGFNSDSEQMDEGDSPEPESEPDTGSGGNRRYPSCARHPPDHFGHYLEFVTLLFVSFLRV